MRDRVVDVTYGACLGAALMVFIMGWYGVVSTFTVLMGFVLVVLAVGGLYVNRSS